jgi:hypothetical protein
MASRVVAVVEHPALEEEGHVEETTRSRLARGDRADAEGGTRG